MKSILIQVLAVLMTSTAYAGNLESIRSSDLATGPQTTLPAPAAPKALTEFRGSSEGNFCFELAGEFNLAKEARMPEKFCVSKLALERISGGKMNLLLNSDNPKLRSGAAAYVFEQGTIKYVSAKVFGLTHKTYLGELNILAPVYPNGNLIPGAEIKIKAVVIVSHPNRPPVYTSVPYSKPQPPAPPVPSGPCFTRGAQETADQAGMPVKFCVAGAQLIRGEEGLLSLAVTGDLPGKFKASYIRRSGVTYVQAEIYNHHQSLISSYGGIITLLLPAMPNGELDIEGQPLVEAQAGFNWDLYHSDDWNYEPVEYIPGPAK